jgi:hypothetical protein
VEFYKQLIKTLLPYFNKKPSTIRIELMRLTDLAAKQLGTTNNKTIDQK